MENLSQKEQESDIRPVNKRVTRTSAGLRDALFEELDSLRNGFTHPLHANAIARMSNAILNTVRAEISYSSHLKEIAGDTPATVFPSIVFKESE